MHWIKTTLRSLALGAALGAGIALVGALVGFAGGQGWQPAVAGKALGLLLLILLLLLLGTMLSTGYGHHVGRRQTVEEQAKQAALIPLFLAMVAVVMAAYLWIQPPLVYESIG